MSFMLKWVPPRYKALLFGRTCDPQSKCATTAVAIMQHIERDLRVEMSCTEMRPICGLTSRGFSEIMLLLDHESLLTSHGCNALATLTVEHALRSYALQEDVCRVLESLHSQLQSQYRPCADVRLDELAAVHMGRGMQYLKLRFEHRS